MKEYNPSKIEKKWQKFWEKKKLFQAADFSDKPKMYFLVEFPYPSGEGLHVGHCRSYTGLDILTRKRRMQGENVLFPMGWDAFGLPAENYAIKTGTHPALATKKAIQTFKRQEKSLGLSFDWSREINTTDPKYYKWTQWIFVKLFREGLAYKAKMPINWCTECKIGLANEEVVDGRCERCGGGVVKKEKEQWMLKITKYADRLLKDLNQVDYPDRVKALQRDWVGRSEGYEIVFPVVILSQQAKNLKTGDPLARCCSLQDDGIGVFTTRIDTIFGATYLVLSPEHPILKELSSFLTNKDEVEKYIKQTLSKSDIERQENKEKTGVKLEGVTAVNPANNKQIPIFIADYVLMGYGTGAIMAVPAHDQRDFEFAKKYKLPIIEVISGGNIDEAAYSGEGVLVNSGEFSGLESKEVVEKIGEWLDEKGLAKKQVNYKLRDWVFSRQRYWGEPIPMINCEKCGWVAVPEDDLPVELPDIKEYEPTETGESPLAKAEKWVNVKCPQCKGKAKRETDVMPNWAGSNWYFMRYCDSKNDKELASKDKLKYWLPVDWYNGGMEHTTLHLLYSRFIYKFLWDIGAVPRELGCEPYKKRTSHGMVLAEGGVKMSKSKGNVINPDDVIKDYGADTLRLYEMFMGPFEQAISWDTNGVKGARRFLDKVWRLQGKIIIKGCNPANRGSASNGAGEGSHKETETLRLAPQGDPNVVEKLLHKTIKKVSEDIEALKFNTAISGLMILVNEMEKQCYEVANHNIEKEVFEDFLRILSPFAPHLAEELWQELGGKHSIFLEKWPQYDIQLIKEEKITLVVQVNGKVRGKLEVESGISEDKAKDLAQADEKVKQWLDNKEIKRVVFIKDKLINFSTS